MRTDTRKEDGTKEPKNLGISLCSPDVAPRYYHLLPATTKILSFYELRYDSEVKIIETQRLITEDIDSQSTGNNKSPNTISQIYLFGHGLNEKVMR
jgi:hypothetical protein